MLVNKLIKHAQATAGLAPHLLDALPGLCLQQCGHCDHAPHDAVVATLELIAGLTMVDCAVNGGFLTPNEAIARSTLQSNAKETRSNKRKGKTVVDEEVHAICAPTCLMVDCTQCLQLRT